MDHGATVSRRRCFPIWCVILQPSRMCYAALCLHLLACRANGSRKARFWLTWYILKGMYLKPPSSVEYSISFLFMAQNWSNLSVTRQTFFLNKPVFSSTYTFGFFCVFFPNVIIWMCRISKTVMFLTVNLTFYMKKFFYLFLKKNKTKSIQIILGLP